MQNIRNDFPIFASNPELIYLDTASTMQKSQIVIDAVASYLSQDYANIHRGTYDLSLKSEELYRQARKTVAQFIGAKDESEIIFTSNSTDSVNLLVWSLLRSKYFKPGDNIVLTELEHHANLVPRQMAADMAGVELRWISVGSNGSLDVDLVKKTIDTTTKIVALSACSNVTGRLWMKEVKEICEFLKTPPPSAPPLNRGGSLGSGSPLVVVDASQAVVHATVDVQELGCDVLFFTGHKLGALTGVGVLRGRQALLKTLRSGKVGGGAVEQVTANGSTYLGSPDKFEPGTPNVVGAISLAVAIEYMQGMESQSQTPLSPSSTSPLARGEEEMILLCLQEFKALEEAGKIALLGGYDIVGKIGLFSFVPKNIDVAAVDQAMQKAGIAIRSGAHCTHIYHAGLASGPTCGVQKSCRMSLGMYNTIQDVEAFFAVLDGLLTR